MKGVDDSSDKENRTCNRSSGRKEQDSAYSAFPGNDEAEGETLKQFHLFQQRTLSAPLWNDHPGLAECIVSASLTNGKKSAGSLVLEEHCSALLSTSRKMIKAATEAKQTQQKFDNLFIAVHVLRALVPVVESRIEHLESSLRLLYHLVSVATDCVKRGKNRAALVALAGYEALGLMMLRYSCQMDEGTIGFELVRTTENRINWFVKPIISKKRKNAGTMTFRQVLAIAMKTTLSIANILKQLWWLPNEKQEERLRTSDASFGAFSRYAIDANLDRRYQPHYVTIELLQNIYIPWLSFLSHTLDEGCEEDLSSYCKGAHRILWDAASKLKSDGKFYRQEQLEIFCLRLRKHAILMLLPSMPSACGTIQERHLESACSYAWKAASVYVQQVSLSTFPVAMDHPLSEFHSKIGERIDNMVVHCKALPLCYVEYYVHRFLHLGNAVNVRSTNNEQSFSAIFTTHRQAQEESSLSRSLLEVALLGLKSRQTLESLESDDRKTKSSTVTLDNLPEIFERFDTNVVADISNLHLDTRGRCFKLLSFLSLHRTIFISLKRDSWVGNELELEIAARILTKYVARFTFWLIKEGANDMKGYQLYETLVESYIRPLAAYERLSGHYLRSDPGLSKYYMELADEVVNDICNTLVQLDTTTSKLPLSCIERYAKVSQIWRHEHSNFFLSNLYLRTSRFPRYPETELIKDWRKSRSFLIFVHFLCIRDFRTIKKPATQLIISCLPGMHTCRISFFHWGRTTKPWPSCR